MLLPGRHCSTSPASLLVIYFGYAFVNAHSVAEAMTPMIVMTVIALLFGIHMVMAIGGADMPVVVSMLNSYSGWAAAATGFMLTNDLLIVDRRAGRLERRDPVVHHVRGDEPQLPQRDRRRLRHRQRRAGRGRRRRSRRAR